MNRLVTKLVNARIPGRFASAPLGTALLALVLCCNCTFDRDSNGVAPSHVPDQEIVRMRSEFGVGVHLMYSPEAFFPEYARRSPVSARGAQIERVGAKRIKPLIADFLKMYPPPLIADNLRNIYLLKHLSFYGREYGGTFIQDSIYVAVRAQGGDSYDLYLSALMHSEFSSILLRNYSFPTDEWSRINESGWRYIGSGKELLGRPDLFSATEDLLRRGFTCAYGEASLEEDVNMYVFAVIERKSSLITAAARHRRVQQKLRVLRRFYERISRELHVSGKFRFLTMLKAISDPAAEETRPPIYIANGE